MKLVKLQDGRMRMSPHEAEHKRDIYRTKADVGLCCTAPRLTPGICNLKQSIHIAPHVRLVCSSAESLLAELCLSSSNALCGL